MCLKDLSRRDGLYFGSSSLARAAVITKYNELFSWIIVQYVEVSIAEEIVNHSWSNINNVRSNWNTFEQVGAISEIDRLLRNITENRTGSRSWTSVKKENREKLSVAVNLRATFSTLDYRVDYRVAA